MVNLVNVNKIGFCHLASGTYGGNGRYFIQKGTSVIQKEGQVPHPEILDIYN